MEESIPNTKKVEEESNDQTKKFEILTEKLLKLRISFMEIQTTNKSHCSNCLKIGH